MENALEIWTARCVTYGIDEVHQRCDGFTAHFRRGTDKHDGLGKGHQLPTEPQVWYKILKVFVESTIDGD